MTLPHRPWPEDARRGVGVGFGRGFVFWFDIAPRLLICLVLAATSLSPVESWSRGATPATKNVSAGPLEPKWSDLTPAERESLRPLESEWGTIDSHNREMWLGVASRFPKLSPEGQDRVQQRMAAWAWMTPRQRSDARLNYEETKQMPLQDRRKRWEAYEALSPERRQELAERALSRPDPSRRLPSAAVRLARPGHATAPQVKSNITPNPLLAIPPRSVSPAVVQARPGATTTWITKRPSPPGHQQAGLPKIAATPGFVDQATLLPQRGPQGAAARSSAGAQPAQ